jgi:hypothetical protein
MAVSSVQSAAPLARFVRDQEREGAQTFVRAFADRLGDDEHAARAPQTIRRRSTASSFSAAPPAVTR